VSKLLIILEETAVNSLKIYLIFL